MVVGRIVRVRDKQQRLEFAATLSSQLITLNFRISPQITVTQSTDWSEIKPFLGNESLAYKGTSLLNISFEAVVDGDYCSKVDSYLNVLAIGLSRRRADDAPPMTTLRTGDRVFPRLVLKAYDWKESLYLPNRGVPARAVIRLELLQLPSSAFGRSRPQRRFGRNGNG